LRPPGARSGRGSQGCWVVTRLDDATGIDRVAIVTGGSRGLGREVTRTLARRGYPVVVNYARNQRAAEATVDEVLATNGIALAVRADVADELDVERLFAETSAAFGGVDVLVHAAGRVFLAPVAELDLQRFDAVQRTNVRSTFTINREAARRLRRGGSIVNLSCAVAGPAAPASAAYAASKAAVEVITQVLAKELAGRDITVNAVAPGWRGTVRPSAIADLVAYLVGGDARGLNGQVIRVDAGTA
jgi:3-oxoacyl-[acyl-carrier protein] reductase